MTTQEKVQERNDTNYFILHREMTIVNLVPKKDRLSLQSQTSSATLSQGIFRVLPKLKIFYEALSFSTRSTTIFFFYNEDMTENLYTV